MSDHLSYYKNKNILVTGATGYIGSAVIAELSSVSCKITALLKKGEKLSANGKEKAAISSRTADIRDKKIWSVLLDKIEIVFHFAAQTSAGFANENPSLDAAANLLPVANLIEFCIKSNLRPDIVFSGTATEAGLTKEYPVNESFKDNPITVYDIHKLAAEKYLQYYSTQLKARAVTLRLANVYGPGKTPGSADRGILNAMIRRALKAEPITIYGNGNFVRDYVYIDDVRDAFLAAGARMNRLSGNYYIIGSGKGYTIKEAFSQARNIVQEKTGINCKIIHIPLPSNLSRIELRNFVADTRNFQVAAGWKPKITLEKGISLTTDYFLKEKK